MRNSYKNAANALRDYAAGLNDKMLEIMSDFGDDVCRKAWEHLEANGSVDTGNLLISIHQETYVNDDGNVQTDVIADAKNDNGSGYAAYVEYGTGIYAENGDGRMTPWRYQDREGNWHTTHGQRPKPYMRPAVEEAIAEIPTFIQERLRKL